MLWRPLPCYSSLVTCHSSLTTRHSPLTTRHSPLVTYHRICPLAVYTLLKYFDAMATSTASKKKIARLIAQFAEEQPDVLGAYLFGSAVQNRLTADSDVDIGMLFETSPDGIQLLELQENLSTLLKRQADLVDLNHVSPILGMQVLKHGEIVFERSERAVRKFQVRTMFAYFDLKQVRKPIEEALLSS